MGFVPVTQQVFNPAAAGTVLDQTPKPAEPNPQGTQIQLSVSKGPAPFQLPSVKGRTCSDAKGALEGLGMKVSVQSSNGGAAACGGNKVLEQDPLAGSTGHPGEEATLYVTG
jgi:beta-lactam-binding protein with PASTA domain